MAKSPAHAKYALDNEQADTPAMLLGRLVHAIALETKLPIVWPGDRRGKAWLEFAAEHEGKEIVKLDEFDKAQAMVDALLCHSEARELLQGTRERTILFDFAGRPCRATPDIFNRVELTELKTTYDAHPSRFPFHATRMGYVAQLAWQKDALAAAKLAYPDRVSIVAVENKPPYAVTVFGVTPQAEEFGRRLYRTWLEEFLICESANHWPSYGPGVLDAPENALQLVGADGESFDVTD